MKRVRLICWNEAEAKEKAAVLRATGYDVDAAPFDARALRRLRDEPPAAVVIDLSRIPSHGRDVALALRSYKATRAVPLVFVGGEPAKVERVKTLLPDAAYAEWRGVRGALRRALAKPPAAPVVPPSRLAGYAGAPLPKKLGVKAGMTVVLLGAPAGFVKTLGALPPGVVFRRMAGRADLTIWFARSRRDLERRIAGVAVRAGAAPLWVAWPKQTSRLAGDLTQNVVRAAGLAAGLVDYKVCAIDDTWAALKFKKRRG